ncbi:YkvA family protein [Halalkalibacter kiskunsagensis]|uniref:YkvA family protein n=1 Tax=Halalkalibacter kiskunsagensis TaxID=1548599 RepID=A0ABV6KAW9_9BACI
MRKVLKRITFIFKVWKFVPFLKDYFLSKEVSKGKKVIGVLLIVVYVIFPFDIIPDFLTFIGIIDDIVIATFIFERMVKMAPESLKRKYDV